MSIIEVSGWTDERTDLLKQLWSKGKSASQIAINLGSVTRNAVIGKVHRLGLVARGKDATPKPRPPRIRAKKPASYIPPAVYVPKPTQASLPPIPEQIGSAEFQCTFMELTDSRCHWPVGDPTHPDFRYCGAAVAGEEHCYCDFHYSVGHVPTMRGDERRRQRNNVVRQFECA